MKEIGPETKNRSDAFALWMKAPMPIVTPQKAYNVNRIERTSQHGGLKFNMLLCWCIGKAASGIQDFYMLPVGERMMQYDHLYGFL